MLVIRVVFKETNLHIQFSEVFSGQENKYPCLSSATLRGRSVAETFTQFLVLNRRRATPGCILWIER